MSFERAIVLTGHPGRFAGLGSILFREAYRCCFADGRSVVNMQFDLLFKIKLSVLKSAGVNAVSTTNAWIVNFNNGNINNANKTNTYYVRAVRGGA